MVAIVYAARSGSERCIAVAAEPEDEVLMRAVARGDQRALRSLMERHMLRSIRLAARVAGNAADADEIGQEAFVRVWRHAARYDARRGRFSTWLYQIVTNLALDRRRKRQYAPLDEAGEVADGKPAVDEVLIDREKRLLAQQAIDALPERQRAALILFHLEGLSGRESAAVLGVTEKGLESLLSRGRAACREFVRMRRTEGEGR